MAAAASSSSSVGDAHREQTGKLTCTPADVSFTLRAGSYLSDRSLRLFSRKRSTDSSDRRDRSLSSVSLVVSAVTDRPVPLSDLQTDLTDLVTVATDFTVTDTGHPAVTDHTQAAGSVTEQYNPSGQGPEGSIVVFVCQVQKMWNWRIPADFHIKPRVRLLRYRFQCTDQSAWPVKHDSSH
ncbi:hypothetical protein F2P81_022919 [Scophthalmus maximus]|uniref:Uncharacterized protein n=1 Tax=Scophthalmus maximus TaxID=52904 RepID=A0A6A4RUX6_SCOMX|nr:hypothetical protein F2P81_022919 [Scophthalmus maximus]